MPSLEELKQLQALPLEIKVMKSKQRIREWVEHYGKDNVCVAFSGGKDSTVLLHLVRELYPNIKAIFSDTGLEYPEIRNFVKTIDNVEWVKPKQTFSQITRECGYPLFSKEVAGIIRYARKIGGGIRQLNTIDNEHLIMSMGGGYSNLIKHHNSKEQCCWANELSKEEIARCF